MKSTSTSAVATGPEWLDESIANAVVGARRIAAEAGDFPHIFDHGAWRFTSDGVWTGGFWAGILWLAAEQAQSDLLRRQAIAFTDRLLPRARDARNHDLGFMFYPSAIAAWRVTRDAHYLEAAKTAAISLAGQFNSSAGFIPGWGFFGGAEWSGSMLVDTLMNLPLLVFAAQHGGSPKLLDVTRRHAAKTLEYHLRPDGSVYHVYRFDPSTGAPLGGATYQGLNAESVWTRGQAWAITGLAILAAMLGDDQYKAASEKVAAYFLAHLPEDSAPPWDFKATPAPQPKDSSAGAIASYGLLRLFEITHSKNYLDAAMRLLENLRDTCENHGNKGGFLLHATADLPHGLGIDGSAIYGDYYWFKALVRLKAIVSRPSEL